MQEIFKASPIIPVLTLHDLQSGKNIVQALIDGGINTIEIVLRTREALEILAAIVKQFPHCHIGAGTLLSPGKMHQAVSAGAKFMVSPGLNEELISTAENLPIPYLPGVMTPSEIMYAIERGFHFLKLFPANLAGGVAALKAYNAVFSQIKFCPTGGIDLNNLKDFSRLDNVIAVGGSWLIPQEFIRSQNWVGITKIAQESLYLLEK